MNLRIATLLLTAVLAASVNHQARAANDAADVANAAPAVTPAVTLAPTTVTAQASTCDIESIHFAQCLSGHAEDLVKQDPTKPKARMAYHLTLTNRVTGKATTVDVLAAWNRPVTDLLGNDRFTLQAGTGADASSAAVTLTIGSMRAAGDLHSGESATVALNDAESLTVTRL